MAQYSCPNRKCHAIFPIPDWLDTEIICPKCGTKAIKGPPTSAPSQFKPANEPTSLSQKPSTPISFVQKTEPSSGATSAYARRKILVFGIVGAAGCFVAALASEALLGDAPVTTVVGVIVTTGLWTAALGIGVTLALICGQNMYLHRSPLTRREVLRGISGGLVAGAVAGGSAECFFQIAQRLVLSASYPPWIISECGRLIAWAIFGALLGLGAAFFVPNLQPIRGLLGGAVGGAIGGLGFIFSALILSDTIGRFTGPAIVGFCIGAMLALVEVLFREAWLEIRYGPKETITVNLGEKAVAIGGNSSACTVFAVGAPPVALRYRLVGGQIECEDVVGVRTSIVRPGDERKVGTVSVKVCAVGG